MSSWCADSNSVVFRCHVAFTRKCACFLYCSIRNNNGRLPAEVALMCGYNECAKYLDAATKRQESQLGGAKGVYQAEPDKRAMTTPSPHDITTSPRVEPCVILQGLNQGRLPPPGPGGDYTADTADCEMETESQDTGAAHVDPSVHCVSDMTLSSKEVVVAGRKRTREDTDDVEHKRIRTNGEYYFFGTVSSGDCSTRSPRSLLLWIRPDTRNLRCIFATEG